MKNVITEKNNQTIIHNIPFPQINKVYKIEISWSFTGQMNYVACMVYNDQWDRILLWDGISIKDKVNKTIFYITPFDYKGYTWKFGVWMEGDASYQIKSGDSVSIYELKITMLKEFSLIDSSGNGNHRALIGSFFKRRDDPFFLECFEVCRDGGFNNGVFWPISRSVRLFGNYEMTLSANDHDWHHIDLPVISKIFKKGYRYTLYVKVKHISGPIPTHASIAIYDYTTQNFISYENGPLKSDGTGLVEYTLTWDIVEGHDIKLICYAGRMGSAKHISIKWYDFVCVEYFKESFKPVLTKNHEWSHARWCRFDSNQSSDQNPRLYNYGYIDYSFVDIVSNGGKPGNVVFVTHNYKVDKSCYIAVAYPQLFDDKWHHIVVTTKLYDSFCEKQVYIDGVFIGKDRLDADFSGMNVSNYEYDFAVNKSPSDPLITEQSTRLFGYFNSIAYYDRILTAEEVKYLFDNKNFNGVEGKLYGAIEYKRDLRS